MVTQKGNHCYFASSEVTRGFGFIQYAAVEDAKRAIELKNDSPIGGRKVRVKLAMHRLPREHRQQKANKVCLEEEKVNNDAVDLSIGEDNHNGDAEAPFSQKEKPCPPEASAASSGASQVKLADGVPIDKAAGSEKQRLYPKLPGLASKYRCLWYIYIDLASFEALGRFKQGVARTVVFGGLLSSEMAVEVFRQAVKAGTICSITYPLPREELDLNGLSRDGCKPEAAAVLFTSVKSARQAVALLHQQEINCGCVWARQMGGEGSKRKEVESNCQEPAFQGYSY